MVSTWTVSLVVAFVYLGIFQYMNPRILISSRWRDTLRISSTRHSEETALERLEIQEDLFCTSIPQWTTPYQCVGKLCNQETRREVLRDDYRTANIHTLTLCRRSCANTSFARWILLLPPQNYRPCLRDPEHTAFDRWRCVSMTREYVSCW